MKKLFATGSDGDFDRISGEERGEIGSTDTGVVARTGERGDGKNIVGYCARVWGMERRGGNGVVADS